MGSDSALPHAAPHKLRNPLIKIKGVITLVLCVRQMSNFNLKRGRWITLTFRKKSIIPPPFQGLHFYKLLLIFRLRQVNPPPDQRISRKFNRLLERSWSRLIFSEMTLSPTQRKPQHPFPPIYFLFGFLGVLVLREEDFRSRLSKSSRISGFGFFDMPCLLCWLVVLRDVFIRLFKN